MLDPMRRAVLIATAALAALVAVPASGAIPGQTTSPVRVHVTPGTGGPRTSFTLSFRSPIQTGQMGLVHRAQTVELQGTHRRGCVWSGQMAAPSAAAHHMVRLTLRPAHMTTVAGGATWCAGTFRGSIVQTERFNCAPPNLCPMIEIRPQTIAHFNFTVRHRS
jgi:hypothetical protein